VRTRRSVLSQPFHTVGGLRRRTQFQWEFRLIIGFRSTRPGISRICGLVLQCGLVGWRVRIKAHRLLYHSTLGLRVIEKKKKNGARPPGGVLLASSSLLSSLELSDTKVHEPQIRALLGTASHFCEEVVGGSCWRGAVPSSRTPASTLNPFNCNPCTPSPLTLHLKP